MGLKYSDIVVALILNLFKVYLVRSEDILSCDAHALFPCPDDVHQYCNATVSRCMCESGYFMVEKRCQSQSEVPDSHAGIVALVVILMLVLTTGGLVLVVRKYNLVEYVRQKINARRNGEVMYEDVMIGQDDPPLNL